MFYPKVFRVVLIRSRTPTGHVAALLSKTHPNLRRFVCSVVKKTPQLSLLSCMRLKKETPRPLFPLCGIYNIFCVVSHVWWLKKYLYYLCVKLKKKPRALCVLCVS